MKFLLLLSLIFFTFNYVYSSDLENITKMTKANSLSREGETLRKEKKFDLALAKIEEALKIDDNSYNALITKAKIEIDMNDPIQAKATLNKILTLKPEDTFANDLIKRLNLSENGEISTKHFIFKKVPKDKAWATKLPLEKSYEKISNYVPTEIKEPIGLYFFETEEEFFENYGTVHLYKKGKLLGVADKKRNSILINAIVNEKEALSVISHELVHFFISDKMKDSKLYGLEEGLANFIGGRVANYLALKSALLFDTEKRPQNLNFKPLIFTDIKEMTDYEKKRLSYYEISTALIEFINSKKGAGALKTYINDLMRNDTDYYRMLWASMGFLSSEEFEDGFYKFIQVKIKALK